MATQTAVLYGRVSTEEQALNGFGLQSQVTELRVLAKKKGYTIAGAREHLKQEARGAKSQAALPFAPPRQKSEWKRVRQSLQEILTILSPKRPAIVTSV